MRLAVAATAPFGADVLERLARHHDVAALVTRPDRPRGRGRRPGPPPAKEAAERLGIPALQPERLDASLELPAETIVVAAYGALIPDALLDRALWLNVHPSLLPRWRGAAPIERAIEAGDRETGVSIMRPSAEMDAGPVCLQAGEPILDDDDFGTLSARLERLAAVGHLADAEAERRSLPGVIAADPGEFQIVRPVPWEVVLVRRREAGHRATPALGDQRPE